MRLALGAFLVLALIWWMSTPSQRAVSKQRSTLSGANVSVTNSFAGLSLDESSFRDLVHQHGAGKTAVVYSEEPGGTGFEVGYSGAGVTLFFAIPGKPFEMFEMLKGAARDPDNFAFAQPVAAEAKLASLQLRRPWSGQLAGPTETEPPLALRVSVLQAMDAWGPPAQTPRLLEPPREDESDDAPTRYLPGPIRLTWLTAGARRTLTFERLAGPETEPPTLVGIQIATVPEPATPSNR